MNGVDMKPLRLCYSLAVGTLLLIFTAGKHIDGEHKEFTTDGVVPKN